jgi:hypothetical protein
MSGRAANASSARVFRRSFSSSSARRSFSAADQSTPEFIRGLIFFGLFVSKGTVSRPAKF